MIDTATVERLIREGESLTVEFKGEEREKLPDRDIYEAVVCLANAEGGTLLLGVENDGRVTGARPRDLDQLRAAIFNNTVPAINTDVSQHIVEGLPVVAIELVRRPGVYATARGRCVRRVMGSDGPRCDPFLPHQHVSRRSDLGELDYSALSVEGATWADLDPLEFERIRQTIRGRPEADKRLLDFADDGELAKAMELVQTVGDRLVPNVAGLLLLGRKEALRSHLPTHEVAFQVLDARSRVPVNDFFCDPLLKTLEAVEERFSARNDEQEVQVGLFRLPVPDYSLEAFREAVNNAVQHRDYARLGTVHVQMYPDYLFVANPGGFVEGITLDNLLVHEPKPRNRRLADAFRSLGLVERTGRGIDRIYREQLRYGRPVPDYTQSSSDGVRLVLRGGAASLEFAAFVYEQDRADDSLSLDDLLVLNHLQHERRVDTATVGGLTQRGEAHARGVLERLVERGLIEARGERRGRVYHLSAELYRRLGEPAGYVRAHGFDRIRQEAMVLEYVKGHGRITRRDAAELCSLGLNQASRRLRQLRDEGKLVKQGKGRGSYYELPSEE